MKSAIFLDRDGVIIENRANYVRVWTDVQIFPQALESLARLSKSDFGVVIVTNQSAVGRGIISFQAATEINNRLVAEIRRAGGRIDAVYMCPHAPGDSCGCRKPLPGLLFRAARDLKLELSSSYMIGDALTDVAAGHAAGVNAAALVLTGRGTQQLALADSPLNTPDAIFDDLSAALSALNSSRAKR